MPEQKTGGRNKKFRPPRGVLYEQRVQVPRADEHGEEGKVDEQKFEDVFFCLPGAHAAVGIEGDEAGERGDGRAQPADVDGDEQGGIV